MKFVREILSNKTFIKKISNWQEHLTSCQFEYDAIDLDKFSKEELYSFIKPINQWITTYKLRYRIDESQKNLKSGRYFTPDEIKSLTFGDCEEQAIFLLYQLTRQKFPQNKIGCISLYKGRSTGHLAVFIEHLDDILIIDNGYLSTDLLLLSELISEWKIRGCFNFNEMWTYKCLSST